VPALRLGRKNSTAGRSPAARGIYLSTLSTALALMLVIEGLLPLLAPGTWRETFRRLTELKDGQLRFIGMAAVLAGVLMLLFTESP
jgi:uncharacterized protein YjeT (DUF2065 family)